MTKRKHERVKKGKSTTVKTKRKSPKKQRVELRKIEFDIMQAHKDNKIQYGGGFDFDEANEPPFRSIHFRGTEDETYIPSDKDFEITYHTKPQETKSKRKNQENEIRDYGNQFPSNHDLLSAIMTFRKTGKTTSLIVNSKSEIFKLDIIDEKKTDNIEIERLKELTNPNVEDRRRTQERDKLINPILTKIENDVYISKKEEKILAERTNELDDSIKYWHMVEKKNEIYDKILDNQATHDEMKWFRKQIKKDHQLLVKKIKKEAGLRVTKLTPSKLKEGINIKTAIVRDITDKKATKSKLIKRI